MSPHYTVRFLGWRTGLQTIPLILLIRDIAKLGLRDAKEFVESILEGKTMCLSFNDILVAENLRQMADDLGAVATLESS